MTISRTAGATAPERAYDWLKTMIVTLPREEERFLTEAEIAASSGLSRTPVREALMRLEAEGFIRRVPHKGSFIPALSDQDVESVMQARNVIEQWSVREVARNPGRLPIRLEAIMVQQERDDDPVDFIDHDIEFHTTILRAAGNPLLSDFYISLRDRQGRMGVRIVMADRDRTKRVIVEHRAIAEAITAGDPEAAVQAMDTHLNTTLSSMMAPRI